jgi:hypothetical protein
MIKKYWNRVTSVSLSLAFLLNTGGFTGRIRAQGHKPEPDRQADVTSAKQGLPPGHSYWKVQVEEHDKDGKPFKTTYDGAIIDVWRCPERGICAALHSVDPHDEKMRKLAAKVLKKKPVDITDNDVLQFCGYQADLQEMTERQPGSQTGPLGKWSGTIDIRIKGLPGQTDPNGTKVAFISKLHVNIEEIGTTLLHAQAYKGIPLLGGEADLVPVTDPPPGCAVPPAPSLTAP